VLQVKIEDEIEDMGLEPEWQLKLEELLLTEGELKVEIHYLSNLQDLFLSNTISLIKRANLLFIFIK